MRCHPPAVIIDDGLLMDLLFQGKDFAALLARYRLHQEIGKGLTYRRSWRLAEPYAASGPDCQSLTTRP